MIVAISTNHIMTKEQVIMIKENSSREDSNSDTAQSYYSLPYRMKRVYDSARQREINDIQNFRCEFEKARHHVETVLYAGDDEELQEYFGFLIGESAMHHLLFSKYDDNSDDWDSERNVPKLPLTPRRRKIIEKILKNLEYRSHIYKKLLK